MWPVMCALVKFTPECDGSLGIGIPHPACFTPTTYELLRSTLAEVGSVTAEQVLGAGGIVTGWRIVGASPLVDAGRRRCLGVISPSVLDATVPTAFLYWGLLRHYAIHRFAHDVAHDVACSVVKAAAADRVASSQQIAATETRPALRLSK
jgi:hypothetical protein